VLGHSVPKEARAVLQRVGAIIEAPAFYPNISGRRNLMMRDAAGPGGGRSTRRQRVADALERVGMTGVDDRPVKAYSLGMKQRLGLAAALLRKPDLLILDEPTNGLDPQGIREIRELLIELNEAGTTIFLSSHLLNEIEALCTRVGMISGGKMMVQDQLSVLVVPTGNVMLRTKDIGDAVEAIGRALVKVEGDRLFVESDDPARLNAMLQAKGVRISDLQVERHSLEEVFLAHTKASVFS
jgi:ABC-type multidrug transport system ATPase subunit